MHFPYIGKIIGLTGNVLPSDFAELIAHGADLVLAKPLVKETLVRTLQELDIIR